METPEQVLRKRWAEDELDRLYPMIFSSDHIPATYPERSLYYRDEVKAAVNDALEQAARVSDGIAHLLDVSMHESRDLAKAVVGVVEDSADRIRALKQK